MCAQNICTLGLRFALLLLIHMHAENCCWQVGVCCWQVLAAARLCVHAGGPPLGHAHCGRVCVCVCAPMDRPSLLPTYLPTYLGFTMSASAGVVVEQLCGVLLLPWWCLPSCYLPTDLLSVCEVVSGPGCRRVCVAPTTGPDHRGGGEL